MLRFILNFISYGLLFYILYVLFPDAFSTMVGWAHNVTDFLFELYKELIDKVNEWRRGMSQHRSYREALVFVLAWMGRG